MKKRIYCFILLALCMILPGIRAFAADLPGKTIQVDRKTSIYMNGKKVKVDIIKTADEVYVPLMDACVLFGCDLNQSQENGVIDIISRTPNAKNIKGFGGKLFLGKKTVQVGALPETYYTLNGYYTWMGTVSAEDQVFVPLSYFTELMDKSYTWQKDKNKVLLADFKEKPIGKVNGQEVTQRQYDFYFNKIVQERFGLDGIKNPKATKEAVNDIKREVRRTLASNVLIDAKLREHTFKLSAEDMRRMNDALNDEVEALGGAKNVRSFIKPNNITMGMLINETVKNLLRDVYKLRMTTGTFASEDQMKAEYDAHQAEYKTVYQIRVKHILISADKMTGTTQQDKMDGAKKKAEEILKRIRSGESFDKLMNEFSEDPGLKASPNGYTIQKGLMVKPFEDAAFSMKVGDISEPVETAYGYHIIKVEEIIPERMLTYDEEKPLIEIKLNKELKKTAWEKVLTEWISKAKIEKLILN